MKRARFGFEEIETAFCTWLGGLEDPGRPWRKESRTDYLADPAQRETLIHALDVKGLPGACSYLVDSALERATDF